MCCSGENREVSEERLFHYSAVASQDELFWRKSFKSANTAREEIGNASNFDENINNLINQFFLVVIIALTIQLKPPII